jgi:hypothetical protein
MNIKLKPEDTEIRYLFINEFKWVDPQNSVDLAGHPKVKGIYRAVFNKNDSSYLLAIDNKYVHIAELVSNGEGSYSSKIDEITPKNIIDLNLELEDLKQINKWCESGNPDIQADVKGSPVELDPVIKMLHTAIQNAAPDIEKMNDGCDLFCRLFDMNSIQAELIMDLMEELIELNASEVDDVSMTTTPSISLSKGFSGKGFNIGKAYESLQTYSGKNRRTNEDPVDLTNALVYIIKEQERRIINELD